MKDISVDEDISSLGESMKTKTRVEHLRIGENIHDITGICVYVVLMPSHAFMFMLRHSN